MNSILWLRSDLRVQDNPALVAAMNHGSTIAVYCLCEGQWNEHGVSPAKRSLIVRQLYDLHSSLDQINVPLIVINADRFESVPECLLQAAQKFNASHIFTNDEYEFNERACAQQARQLLAKEGVVLSTYVDQCMIAPGTLLNQQGDMFKVFSAFKRKFLSSFVDLARGFLPAPKQQKSLSYVASDLSELDKFTFTNDRSELWPAGEQEALARLDRFIEGFVGKYHENRDHPALDATSQLSPYLAVGALSTTQCIYYLRQATGEEFFDREGGENTWFNELIWREFYRHLLVAFPRLSQFKPFKLETDALPWKRDLDQLEAWKQGQTGYPIVDAAMRQLNETGWMHNRLRMIVAMFFTKHLFIDWRLGEAYFMSKLVDGDLASNNGGWQWSASTGVDAVPYFRIFNPIRQSQRFDADGDFIRKYVPELSDLNKKDIHAPNGIQAQERGYPLPMVDHAESVSMAKYYFKHLSVMVDDDQPRQSIGAI